MWRHFQCALSFLTILRLPYASRTLNNLTPLDFARSFSCFPLVGFVLGAICFATASLLTHWMPPLLLALLLTTLLALLTRGLHLDGLADFVDGMGGGFTPQRRLEIMKDSRTGAFGALALILAVFWKVAALQTLLLQGRLAPLLFVPVLSRLAMVLAAYRSPYARAEGGLGQPFLAHMGPRQLVAATLLSLSLVVPLTLSFSPVYLMALLALVGFFRRMARSSLGGITGDVLGAINETAELLLFVLSACILPN